jgi:hypothetical protein
MQKFTGKSIEKTEKRCTSRPDVAFRAEATWHDAEVLVVTLVEASNLIVRDFIMKKSDPFCKLKLGKLSRKSSVKSGNLNPIWNEVLTGICLILTRMWLLFVCCEVEQMRLCGAERTGGSQDEPGLMCERTDWNQEMSTGGNEVGARSRLTLSQSKTNSKKLVVLDCIKKQKLDASRIG